MATLTTEPAPMTTEQLRDVAERLKLEVEIARLTAERDRAAAPAKIPKVAVAAPDTASILAIATASAEKAEMEHQLRHYKMSLLKAEAEMRQLREKLRDSLERASALLK